MAMEQQRRWRSSSRFARLLAFSSSLLLAFSSLLLLAIAAAVCCAAAGGDEVFIVTMEGEAGVHRFQDMKTTTVSGSASAAGYVAARSDASL
jgi:hypothetical protein